jgi:hypothetical protein
MIAENMTQRNVSAPAVTDSVAAVVKYVVEKTFSGEITFTGKGGANQATEILKSGPGLPTLYREINDSVACAVRLVVGEVFQPQKLLDLSRDHIRQHEAILNTGPGEDSLFEAVNGSVAHHAEVAALLVTA